MTDTTTTPAETDERAEALAMHLDVLADEIRQDSDQNYTVSPRPAKSGTKPSEYVQNVDDLRSIMTIKERTDLTAAIKAAGKGELNQTERDAIYTLIRDRINGRIEKTKAARGEYRPGLYNARHLEAIDRLKKTALYIENVLYFLLMQNDGSSTDSQLQHAKDYRTAWSGETPDDHRTDYEDNAGEYIVLTDEEADQMTKDYAQNYIDDCILPEVPEYIHKYLDTEKMLDEFGDTSERGSALASYDGNESEIKTDAGTFYIYRTA